MKRNLMDFSERFNGKPIPSEILASDEFVKALCSYVRGFVRKREKYLGDEDVYDISQRTALKVIRAASKPDSLIRSLTAFVNKAAINLIIDLAKKKKTEKKRKETIRAVAARLLSDRSLQGDFKDSRRDSAEDLMRYARENLSRKHLEIILLYQEGHTFTKMAEILKVPIGTINSRFYYVKAYLSGLRDLMED